MSCQKSNSIECLLINLVAQFTLTIKDVTVVTVEEPWPAFPMMQ